MPLLYLIFRLCLCLWLAREVYSFCRSFLAIHIVCFLRVLRISSLYPAGAGAEAEPEADRAKSGWTSGKRRHKQDNSLGWTNKYIAFFSPWDYPCQ